MFLTRLRRICRFILRFIARIDIRHMDRLPEAGSPVILVSNHIGRLDAILCFVMTDRPDMVMFVANKYKQSAIWRYFVNNLDAIWLNREGLDLNAFRQATKRLKQGELLAIAPEGTRSKSGQLIAAKSGAAYLAAKTGTPLIPVSIQGTRDADVRRRWWRLRRVDVTVTVGYPFALPPLPRRGRDDFLNAATDEMMCQIAALLPSSYHGVYAAHPRLEAILEGTGAPAGSIALPHAKSE